MVFPVTKKLETFHNPWQKIPTQAIIKYTLASNLNYSLKTSPRLPDEFNKIKRWGSKAKYLQSIALSNIHTHTQSHRRTQTQT